MNRCVVCGSETPDGEACVAETERARRQLLGDERCDDKPGIVDLVAPARDVAYRQTTGDSIAHGAPGPRDLLDYGAGAKLDAVQNALTGWARVVAEERGSAVWVAMNGDIISQAAHWLAGNLEWLRHKDYVDDVLREIGDCLHAMRSVVATPAGRVYLGECGAKYLDDVTEVRDDGGEGIRTYVERKCDGDVYGRPGATTGGCRTCDAEHDQAERLKRNTALVQGGCYRASQLEHAYGLNAATVRKWAERGLIAASGVDGQDRPLYRLDEVLAVAKSEAARREAARAKRERRKAAQAAGMGA